jgi:uncharacterized membrane protein YphA (DoxX/SURF4 family)
VTGGIVLRGLARPLLGISFIASGVDVLRHSQARARQAESLHVDQVGNVDAQQVTRALGATQIVAGALLALGRFPRLASLMLALTVVPDAATGHAFWSETDKQTREMQRNLFLRDLGLLGGLLVSVADTGGRESVPHLAARTARKAGRRVEKAGRTVEKNAQEVRKAAAKQLP